MSDQQVHISQIEAILSVVRDKPRDDTYNDRIRAVFSVESSMNSFDFTGDPSNDFMGFADVLRKKLPYFESLESGSDSGGFAYGTYTNIISKIRILFNTLHSISKQKITSKPIVINGVKGISYEGFSLENYFSILPSPQSWISGQNEYYFFQRSLKEQGVPHDATKSIYAIAASERLGLTLYCDFESANNFITSVTGEVYPINLPENMTHHVIKLARFHPSENALLLLTDNPEPYKYENTLLEIDIDDIQHLSNCSVHQLLLMQVDNWVREIGYYQGKEQLYCLNDKALTFYKRSDQKKVHEVTLDYQNINSFKFNNDQSKLFVNARGIIYEWDIATGQEQVILNESYYVNIDYSSIDALFSPALSHIGLRFRCSDRFYLYHIKSQRYLNNGQSDERLIITHSPSVYAISPLFSFDGKYFISIFNQETIVITNVKTGAVKKRINFETDIVGMLTSTDAPLLCVATSYPVKLYLLDIGNL